MNERIASLKSVVDSFEEIGLSYERLGMPLLAAEAYQEQAANLMNSDKNREAINLLNKACNLYTKAAISASEYEATGYCFNKVAEAYRTIEQEDKARELLGHAAKFFQKAANEYIRLNLLHHAGLRFQSAGRLFRMAGAYSECLEMYKLAAKSYTNPDETERLSRLGLKAALEDNIKLGIDSFDQIVFCLREMGKEKTVNEFLNRKYQLAKKLK